MTKITKGQMLHPLATRVVIISDSSGTKTTAYDKDSVVLRREGSLTREFDKIYGDLTKVNGLGKGARKFGKRLITRRDVIYAEQNPGKLIYKNEEFSFGIKYDINTAPPYVIILIGDAGRMWSQAIWVGGKWFHPHTDDVMCFTPTWWMPGPSLLK